jgi:cytochrome b subunit of formate dehydrogenase
VITTEAAMENNTAEQVILYNVRRYGTAGRFYHWVHAASMMLFLSTGWQIHISQPIFGDLGAVRTLHIALGIFIIFWDLVVQIAIIAIEGHAKDVIPTLNDVADLIVIILCTLRIIDDKYYPHYDFYDPTLGAYVRKYHPGQKFLSISDILAMLFMGITGIALAELIQSGSTGMMSFLAGATVLFSWLIPITLTNLRFIHFLLFMYFLLTTIFHVYFALIPQNFSRLRAMVTGNEIIKEHTNTKH